MKPGFGYIMASEGRTLYIGSTSNLEQRVWQHKVGALGGFTKRYHRDRLVYMAEFADIRDAIAWERSWKGKTRVRKLELVVSQNPRWNDLAWNWHEGVDEARRKLDEERRDARSISQD